MKLYTTKEPLYSLYATREYCWQLIDRLPAAPKGHIWTMSASWPDSTLKHIYLREYAPAGF